MSYLIEIKNMKLYPKDNCSKPLLENINFKLNKNSIISIIGESGSGKSLFGFSLSSKEYLYNVIKESDSFKCHDYLKNSIPINFFSYIPQEPLSSLNPVITIYEHFEINRITNEKNDSQESNYISLLEEVGFVEPENLLNLYPHELSGGMAQRILIALALQNNPNVLVADEATSSLDAVNEKIILDLLVRISNSRGLSVLVITHDLRIAKNYCNDHYLIQNKTLINLSNNELADLESKAKHQIFDGLDIDNSKEILKVKDLSFGFNDNKNILKKVDFKIHQGEILGLVGLSGSGKSTLTKVLMKIYSPKKGTCTLFEKNLKEYTPKSYASNIQIVFQDLYGSLNPKRKILDILLDSFLIREELKLLSKDRISKNINYREEVDLYLEELGLNKDILLRFPKSLSGGQRQKILILKALLVKPKVIIFDEPMSSLDLKSQNEILSIIKSLYLEHKITILFITHDYRLVQSICNRVMVLSEGTIVEEGKTSKVFTNPSNSATKKILEVVK